MLKKSLLILACLLTLGWLSVNAAESEQKSPGMTIEEFVSSLSFQQGEVILPGGIATLNIPDTFQYLGPDDTERVLVQAWGNPSGGGTLGMLFPTNAGVVSDDSWGVVITYEEDGYVSDDDADSINYDELLQSMQERVVEENKERRKQGYPTYQLVNWAAKPYYDKDSHKLYWAKEIAFAQYTEHTLNYNIRILGRKGVLVLNAISSIKQFDLVEQEMAQVLAFTNFNQGYRYTDFDAKKDKTAAYGLAALVAGGVAAKAGLFSKVFGVLLVAKKFLFAGLIAIMAGITKLVKRNK